MRAEARPDRGAVVGALAVVLAGACWAMAAVLAKYAFERGAGPAGRGPVAVAWPPWPVPGLAAPRACGRRRGPGRPWPGSGRVWPRVGLTYYVAIDHLRSGSRWRCSTPARRCCSPSARCSGVAATARRGGWRGPPPRSRWPGRCWSAGLSRASAGSTCRGWPPGWPRRCCSPPTCSRPSWPAAEAEPATTAVGVRGRGGHLVGGRALVVMAGGHWPARCGQGRARGRAAGHPAAVRPGRGGGAGGQRRRRRDRGDRRAGVRGRLRLAAAGPAPHSGPARRRRWWWSGSPWPSWPRPGSGSWWWGAAATRWRSETTNPPT